MIIDSFNKYNQIIGVLKNVVQGKNILLWNRIDRDIIVSFNLFRSLIVEFLVVFTIGYLYIRKIVSLGENEFREEILKNIKSLVILKMLKENSHF